MAIRSFSVGPLRGLVRAEADGLGNLVVLAGPNGAGKSSLLDLLRGQRDSLVEPDTQVMFIGPHRTWRSSQVSRTSILGGMLSSYGEVLTKDELPHASLFGLQGLQGGYRQSSGADDVQAFVKTCLAQLKDRHNSLITAAWHHQGERVELGTVPNLFAPMARLVETLLPHLEWIGVVDTDIYNIQCLFRPTGSAGPQFDIDELSSGEKAAIALLLPLVERQAEQLITPSASAPGVPLTMLLDEPDLHLHPLLQLQVLQYLRDLAAEGTAQFIISTHSPTLLDALTDDELYLVSPAGLRPDNQLSRLTTSQERLEVAREITGSTHLLTRAKPIVFVEGESDRAGVSSDAQLITQLLPEAKAWALVPGRAKHEVITAVQRLRQEGLELPGTPVFGLVDADRDGSTADDHVLTWSVTMIENLLLDSQAIYDALAPLGNKTAAHSPAAVQAALEQVANNRIEDEVRLRVQRQLPIHHLTIHPDHLDDAEAVASEFTKKWLADLQSRDIAALTRAARGEVESIVVTGTQLERFHGKRLLHGAYQALHVGQAGLAKPTFALLIAAQSTNSARVRRLAGPASSASDSTFPPASQPRSALAVNRAPVRRSP